MKGNKIYKKNDKMAAREVSGELLLLPQYKCLNDLDYVYTLKNTTLEVWRLIDGKKTVREIKKALLKKYDAAEDVISKQLEKFIKEMVAIKAIL